MLIVMYFFVIFCLMQMFYQFVECEVECGVFVVVVGFGVYYGFWFDQSEFDVVIFVGVFGFVVLIYVDFECQCFFGEVFDVFCFFGGVVFELIGNFYFVIGDGDVYGSFFLLIVVRCCWVKLIDLGGFFLCLCLLQICYLVKLWKGFWMFERKFF